MKRDIIFILIICILLSTFSVMVFANGANTGGENADKAVYDSINLTDSERERIMTSVRNDYQDYLRTYGDEDKASLAAGYDIRALNEETGFLKLYYGYDPREDLLSGLSISEAAEKATDFKYMKLVSEEILLYCDIVNDPIYFFFGEYSITEDLPVVGEAYARFYEYIFNTETSFSSAKATKSLGDINILQAYFFDTAGASGHMPPHADPIIVYFVTDQGDFVLYRYDTGYIGNEYLMPAETFILLTEKMYERESLYRRENGSLAVTIYSENCVEGFIDMSPYLIGEIQDETVLNYKEEYKKYQFLVNDPEFMGYSVPYHLAMGMDYKNVPEFHDALKAGGYTDGIPGAIGDGGKNYRDFMDEMSEAGYTTYAECRAALDAAIEANENRLPEDTPLCGDVENTPQPENSGKSKYAFLFWLIPAVVVLIVGASSLIIIRKRKKK